MASSMGDDRFAPPQAHVADVELPAADGLVLASRGRRLAAVLLDMVIGLAVLWAVSKITPWNPFGASDFNMWKVQWENNLWGFVGFVLLHAYLLVTRGQTIGKALLQIRIVRADGSKASAQRILGLRYGLGYAINFIPAFNMVYGIIDSLLIFRSSRRCLHDQIADTVVIKI